MKTQQVEKYFIANNCLSVTVSSGRDKIQSVISLPLLAPVNKQILNCIIYRKKKEKKSRESNNHTKRLNWSSFKEAPYRNPKPADNLEVGIYFTIYKQSG